MKVIAMCTCFNRKLMTVKCIRALVTGNPNIKWKFIIVDDNSVDGTREALSELPYDVEILKGNGTLYYSGGMRLAMNHALAMKDLKQYDYAMIFNDDVEFNARSIEEMAVESKKKCDAVIVGAMKWFKGGLSYGGIKYTKGIAYQTLGPEQCNIKCDTFCANCVLLPIEAFIKTGSINPIYVHSLGDFDYGMKLSRGGFDIYTSSIYVGECNDNSSDGTWRDNSLPIKERIRKKESVKGNPTKQWFYYLNKYFGWPTAIYSCITPYVRILLRK